MAACILRFNEGRDPERLDMKYEAMRQSPFAFFRGTCHLFWEDWPRDSPLDSAPATWVCGDLHLENFGTYMAAFAERQRKPGFFKVRAGWNGLRRACRRPRAQGGTASRPRWK